MLHSHVVLEPLLLLLLFLLSLLFFQTENEWLKRDISEARGGGPPIVVAREAEFREMTKDALLIAHCE